MRASTRKLLTFSAVAGAGGLAIYAAPSLLRFVRKRTGLPRLFNRMCERVDQAIGWHKLPTPLGLVTLIGIRNNLRERNLYDTTPPASALPTPPREASYLVARSPDGTYNDLQCPVMGSAGTRFGRNVPVRDTWPQADPDILSPSPREVSLSLLTRNEFTPASTLNLLAAAWLQFMIRDWFSHGKSPKDEPWEVPLPPGDDWHENPMRILRTREDPTRSQADTGTPPTYANTETHWWDASQLYGSSREYQQKIRTGLDGKIIVGKNNLVAPDPTALVQLQQAALAGWWLGLEIFFSLFSLEHNAVCDRLKRDYPQWSDENLFQHARLIISALLAKIHTVEWTTAILGHPALQIGMRANWWGLATERIHKLFGRLSNSELISGIPGSATDHYGVPYSLTEEFVAVYRMHPLIPDEITFWSLEDSHVLKQVGFADIAGNRTQDICDGIAMKDILYSFGLMNPGAVQLHNYPRALQTFERPDGLVIDLAAHDVMRIRELGVPRYTRFRELFHLKPVRTFEELTSNSAWREEIRKVYNNDIDSVDLIVGLFAEQPPAGFGFSDTAFRIFVLMASRRLNSDRFFTTDYTEEVYTKTGMDWINDNTLSTVLLRHHPELAPSLRGVSNAFAPWRMI